MMDCVPPVTGAVTDDRRARFSFMGGGHGPRSHLLEYDVSDSSLTLTDSSARAGSQKSWKEVRFE